MFQKVFEYAGPHKKGLYAATAVVLVSVLMGVLPFVLAYQVIAPLVMGAELDASFLILRVALVLVCLVLQAVLYGWGLNLSHKAAYDTLLRLRTALQKRFEKLPLGVIQDKGTGTVKKLFVDDVDSLEVLLAHSMPEGIANLMVPIAVYVAMFFVDWKLALLSLASIPISLIAMMTMYSVGMKKMGPYYMAGQKMNNTIIEYINGMEVVKVFNKDADSYERFRKDVSDYRDYTLAWYKAAWPWMAIYSSLLPCTVILTLPLGAWFVLSGWSALPDLILVLCLSLSIGMPLLKSLGFLPTMPQLNYKISALEQVLDAPELQQAPDSFHGKDDTITYDHVSFGYTKTQPGPDGKPMVISEWNYCYPNSYIFEGPLLAGAYAALQDYDGLMQFYYTGKAGQEANPELGPFLIGTNPMMRLASRCGALLFLRNDVSAAPLSALTTEKAAGLIGTRLPLMTRIRQRTDNSSADLPLILAPSETPDRKTWIRHGKEDSFFADLTRAGVIPPGKAQGEKIVSTTGELVLDPEQGTFHVAAERSEALVLPEKKSFSGKRMRIRNGSAPAAFSWHRPMIVLFRRAADSC